MSDCLCGHAADWGEHPAACNGSGYGRVYWRSPGMALWLFRLIGNDYPWDPAFFPVTALVIPYNQCVSGVVDVGLQGIRCCTRSPVAWSSTVVAVVVSGESRTSTHVHPSAAVGQRLSAPRSK